MKSVVPRLQPRLRVLYQKMPSVTMSLRFTQLDLPETVHLQYGIFRAFFFFKLSRAKLGIHSRRGKVPPAYGCGIILIPCLNWEAVQWWHQPLRRQNGLCSWSIWPRLPYLHISHRCSDEVATSTATNLNCLGVLKLYLVVSALLITLNPCQIFWLITESNK